MATVDNFRNYIKDNINGMEFVHPVTRTEKDGLVEYVFKVPHVGLITIRGVNDTLGALPNANVIPKEYKDGGKACVCVNGKKVDEITGYQVRDLFQQIDYAYSAWWKNACRPNLPER